MFSWLSLKYLKLAVNIVEYLLLSLKLLPAPAVYLMWFREGFPSHAIAEHFSAAADNIPHFATPTMTSILALLRLTFLISLPQP